MRKLALIGISLVAATAATIGVVVVTGGDSAQAAPACGVWTRQASNNTGKDGMQIRFVDDEAIVVDPADSRFEFGAVLWREIVEADDSATLDVLGSDGNYYGATFTRPDDDTLEVTIAVSASGNQQTWADASDLGCTELALADVACGTWTREASNNSTNDGMRVRIAGAKAIVTDAAAGRFAVGDELWQNISPEDGGASLDVLGSDGSYYSATLAALTNDSLKLDVDVTASGNEQTWRRVGDVGCVSAPLSEVACGVWSRLSSNNTSLDGIEIKVTGDSAIVTDPADSWLELGAVVWQDIVEGDGAFTMNVRGSNGAFYSASMTAPDIDTLEVTIAVSASGNQQTWVRVNDVGCGSPAELACGVWERTGSSNTVLDGMKVRIEGSTARLTDPAESPFAIGQELWRNIVQTAAGLQLEVLGTNGNYYPAALSSQGIDTLTLTIASSGAGNQQTWTEIDASGCVFAPGVTEVVCGVWSRTSSTNERLDGIGVIVIGDQGRVVDPAASRYPVGEVMWRYIVDGTDPATAEVRGSDGNYYAAEFTAVGPGELEIQVGVSVSGAAQTWFQTDDSGCGIGVDVTCGAWERTASNNTSFDGMQVVGSGDRALLIESSGSPFQIGDVVWRNLVDSPPAIQLEVLGSDFNYYGAELTAAGLDSLTLDIAAAGSGNEQTWTEINSSGCEQLVTSDIVCGLWTRTSSNNTQLDGMTLRVRNGQGVVAALPSGVDGFSVGDTLWRGITAGARGYSLDVLGTDGNYYPAAITLDGLETVQLTIGASGAGTSQTWDLTESDDCAVPDLTVCGTWTRTASNNGRLDGTVVRVENGEAQVTVLPDSGAFFGIGDVVWRVLGEIATGLDVEVLGSDGVYYGGEITALGVDSLTLTVDAAAAGNEQTWVESGTDGCDLPVSALDATTPTTDPAGTAPTTTTAATTTTTTTSTTTTLPVLTGADCVPGTWLLDSQPFIDALMAAAGAEIPGGVSFGYESGSYRITMEPDGTHTSTREDWTWRADTPEGSLRMVFNGVQTGVATWDDVTIALDEQTNTTQVQLFAVIGGVEQAIPGGTAVNTDTLDAEAPYECVGDQFRITSDGVTSTWNRVG
jgi:hypothetical protein